MEDPILIKELRENLAKWCRTVLEDIDRYSAETVLELHTRCQTCGAYLPGSSDGAAGTEETDIPLVFLKICGWDLGEDEGDDTPPLPHGHPVLN